MSDPVLLRRFAEVGLAEALKEYGEEERSRIGSETPADVPRDSSTLSLDVREGAREHVPH